MVLERADPTRVIRDPIHGLIPRLPDEIRVMNTLPFQRLRRIRQLAMAYLVYPSAHHTRFEHSIGTMHIAGRICERLERLGFMEKEEIGIVRLAGLLHDIGHGPFSHVSDFLLERYYDRDKMGDLGLPEKIHEKITVDILLEWPEMRSVLPENVRRAVAELISEAPKRQFKRDVVSSSLDADKMDYLLRDSYFAGVTYGHFDLEKMVDACYVITSGDESYLAIHHEGIYAAEQLVLAKYHMSQQVYFHRIRAITDAMLIRGLRFAVENGVEPIDRLFTYDGSQEFMERYLEFYDDRIVEVLSRCDHEKVQELFTRLMQRRLFKQMSSLPLEEVDDAIVKDKLSGLGFESQMTRDLEEYIAGGIGADPDFVIVNLQSIKNPTYRSPGHRLDPEEIMVVDPRGKARKVSDFTDLVFNLNTSAPVKEVVRVFAPRDDWNDPENAHTEERNEMDALVRKLILERVALGGV